MKRVFAAALAMLVLRVPVPPAFADCISARCADTTAIEHARGMIQSSCGCTRPGQTHGKYKKCVKMTLRLFNITALIPQKSCRKLIMKCENASICGKLDAAVCCVLKKSTQVKSSIVSKPAQCRKGSACGAFLGLFSKFDACAADGTCAGPTTTTTTSLPTTTTSLPTTTTTGPTTRTTECTTTTAEL